MELKEFKRMNLRRYAKEKYGIECNRTGYAICPFTPDEKNPSFRIHLYERVWRWTDWHLNKADPNFSGTIIDLVARMENISVTAAINKLKEESSDQLIKEFELTAGNDALIESCRQYSGQPNIGGKGASIVILEALWESLRQTKH